MSMRYKGSVMSATPPTTSQTSASGAWTLEQQMQATAAGLWPVNGPFYIEDVFSTFLYTGNGSTQTITNGINLSGNGGLVWIKKRNAAQQHNIYDSARGWDAGGELITNTTDAAQDLGSGYLSVSSTGFSLPTAVYNTSSDTYASWTFREQPKFFDVVTYTGNGSARTIAHNLGSVPGCIIVKAYSGGIASSQNWPVYHTSLPNTETIFLNLTDAKTAIAAGYWNSTTPTSTEFSLGTANAVNQSGTLYVAYLFAHNAGGFGLTGNDNVISCGSFTTDGAAAATVNLGYEPQWILFKQTNASSQWFLRDTMRGWPAAPESSRNLYPNLSNAEENGGGLSPTSTGFQVAGLGVSNTYIYIAIRRGPMRTPTTGTSVFSPVSTSGNVTSITSGFPVDFALGKEIKNSTSYGNYAIDRLRGGAVLLETNTTGAEYTSQTFKFDSNTQFLQSGGGLFYGPSIYWLMRRAPGFFDEVCYTGDGVNGRAISHNLTVAPELIMVKSRSASADWAVYANGPVGCLILNATNAANGIANFPVGTPTATTFSVASSSGVNGSGSTFVAYLFATCPGVSKVGSFTGTGGTQVINCGFTAGSRFVLIKATSTTGSWYVWDSARGIVAGNDPYLTLNTTAAEVTTTDWVDTAATGFELSNAGGNLANSNGVSYIFLAIA